VKLVGQRIPKYSSDLTHWVGGAIAEEPPRPDTAVKASTTKNGKAVQEIQYLFAAVS